MEFKNSEMDQIAEANNIAIRTFKKNYVVNRQKKYGICIFQANVFIYLSCQDA